MNPNAAHYIIGHSHGDNIALKAVALADMADIGVVKTHVCRMPEGRFDFLGYSFERC
jgi:hypothetical protein